MANCWLDVLLSNPSLPHTSSPSLPHVSSPSLPCRDAPRHRVAFLVAGVTFTGTADTAVPAAWARQIYSVAGDSGKPRGFASRIGANHYAPCIAHHAISFSTVAWLKLFVDETPRAHGVDWDAVVFGNGSRSICGGSGGAMYAGWTVAINILSLKRSTSHIHKRKTCRAASEEQRPSAAGGPQPGGSPPRHIGVVLHPRGSPSRGEEAVAALEERDDADVEVRRRELLRVVVAAGEGEHVEERVEARGLDVGKSILRLVRHAEPAGLAVGIGVPHKAPVKVADDRFVGELFDHDARVGRYVDARA